MIQKKLRSFKLFALKRASFIICRR